MRIACSAVFSVLAIGAAPSVGYAQIIIPYSPRQAESVDRVDQPVPVATVTPAGDPIALAHPRRGNGFVLGAATLDLKDPDRPMIAFSIGNPTDSPVLLSTVYVDSVRVNQRADNGTLVLLCRFSPWLSRPGDANETLPPGAAVSVAMPIAPPCAPSAGATAGFLVYLESGVTYPRPDPRGAIAAERTILRGAFALLRSQAQH
ncbi:MAG TPA: hypothetical protein VGL62_14440 [Vicinamibacterales bacterium]|jgi:hypothetical protein